MVKNQEGKLESVQLRAGPASTAEDPPFVEVRGCDWAAEKNVRR